MYDIAIIGAGPAGSTLARLVSKKYKVLLIDKRELGTPPGEKGIVKCCGGLVAPDAQKAIAELGLGLPKNVIVGPQLFAVRTIDFKSCIERYYQRFYINIDRERFDRWLVSLIPDNIDKRFGCMLKSFAVEQDSSIITFSHNGKVYKEKARLLVGADGAFSTVRRKLNMDVPESGKYISIQEWFETDVDIPYFSAIFDEDVTDFYSWTIPKEKLMIVGSAIPMGDDAISKFELLKKKMGKFGFCLGKCVKREGAGILRPNSLSHLITGNKNVALIGEAGGWISPSSAEGLSYGFRSAVALAKSLENGLENFNGQYSKNMLDLKVSILLKNLKSPFMYNDLLRKIVMKSGLLSVDVCDNREK